MEKYIRYKRIVKRNMDNEKKIQDFFDELIADGWEIIFYNEPIRKMPLLDTEVMDIVVVVGKRQENVL